MQAPWGSPTIPFLGTNKRTPDPKTRSEVLADRAVLYLRAIVPIGGRAGRWACYPSLIAREWEPNVAP